MKSDTQLKKRFDLLPNIIGSIKQYMSHETELLTNITKLRVQANSKDLSPDDKVKLDKKLNSAMKSINIMKETRSLSNIEAKLDKVMESSINSFTVNSLKWLKKTGHIGAAGALVGNLLSIKPIISIQKAKLALIGKVRGKKAVFAEMANAASAVRNKYGGDYHVCVGHCDALEDAGWLKEKLANALEMDMNSIDIIEVGASVSIKIGPGSCSWGMVRR